MPAESAWTAEVEVPLRRIACGVLVGLFAAFEGLPAEACFSGGAAPRDLIRDADVIVRVRAVDTSTDQAMSPLDRPVTTVRFLILEQLKGEERLFDLAVRGAGRSTCFADTYQRGGEYLMFLKLLDRRSDSNRHGR